MATGKSINRFLQAVTGLRVEIESIDGLVRRGVLTNVKTRSVKANGDECEIPVEFVLDGEREDPIPFDRTIRIDTAPEPKK